MIRPSRLLVPLALLLLFLLPATPAYAIIGRHDVAAESYLQPAGAHPAVFDIFPGNGAATLIAPEWAVTAAHVAQAIPPDGSHEVQIGAGTYQVVQVVTHPEWSGVHFHDVALVQLSPPVSAVPPLPIYRSEDEVGQIVSLLGRGDYGDGENGALGADGQLRAATNRVEREESGSLWLRFDAPDNEHVTELEGVAGPGDSGGPALLEKDGELFVVGVASFSLSLEQPAPGPGHYGIFDTYTSLARAQAWIDGVLAGELVGAPAAANLASPAAATPTAVPAQAEPAGALSLSYPALVAIILAALVIGAVLTFVLGRIRRE
ncbi:MAG: trypsin-like serine protease [Anaerolineales bacterium]|nr:trypsin-like serine protease [Anaerolineales bacterium]